VIHPELPWDARIELPLLLSVMEHERLPIFVKDVEGRYLACNRAFEKLLGLPRQSILGKTARDVSPPELSAIYVDRDAELLASPSGSVQRYQSEVKSADGTRRAVTFHKSLWYSRGAVAGLVGAVVELGSADADAISELVTRTSLIHALFEESPLGIEIFDASGRLIEINRAVADMFGLYDKSDVIGFDLFADPNVDPSSKEALREGRIVEYEALFSFDKVKQASLYPTKRSGDMTIAVNIVPVRAYADGPLEGFIAIVRDISAQRMNERRLEYLSFHDALTGLFNRAYFETEWDRFKVARFQKVGVVMCDVDGLKRANDTFGHEVGDRLLKVAAETIAAAFRKGDMVARIGGDEFVAIAPGAGDDTLAAKCARLDRSIAETPEIVPGVKLSVSWGHCAREAEGEDLDAVLKRADARMYERKRGKGR
jgi:diguanylate cyclase (GGDEF)-like protein/PAS domain S-box-containing protein